MLWKVKWDDGSTKDCPVNTLKIEDTTTESQAPTLTPHAAAMTISTYGGIDAGLKRKKGKCCADPLLL